MGQTGPTGDSITGPTGMMGPTGPVVPAPVNGFSAVLDINGVLLNSSGGVVTDPWRATSGIGISYWLLNDGTLTTAMVNLLHHHQDGIY
jgi:hypothetical protein